MADLDDLLLKTSRTFALAIPFLPEPTRREVSVAYLLFRIADTFEDGTLWTRSKRIEALHTFAKLLKQGDEPVLKEQARQWLSPPPMEHAGYLELLEQTGDVVGELKTMSGGARAIVVRHAVRTAQGMAQVVARADEKGNLRLSSLQDLKDYCYIVAGIVGELLTELFLHDTPGMGAESARVLTSNMVAFGEALQLVNILKDAGDDAKEGRVYLPATVAREEVLALAREDLDRAAEYIAALQHGGAPRGYQAFTGVSVMLARGALKAIEERGAGAKVPRTFVSDVVAQLETALDSGAELRALMR